MDSKSRSNKAKIASGQVADRPTPQTDPEVPITNTVMVELDEQEWALIRLLRSAGHGTLEALDFRSGKPYKAKAGIQILDFTDEDQRRTIIAGRAVAVDMS